MNNDRLQQLRRTKTISVLRSVTCNMVKPATEQIVAAYGRDSFLVLISCILSLRTRDTVSLAASHRLFAIARIPEQLADLPISNIEELIYPVGFYHQKARSLHDISRNLIECHSGKVPSNEKALLELKGVGRKTAALVLGKGFGIPAICVDTHVHRIANRLGWVTTKTSDQTEIALKELLPKKYWIEINTLFVMWGQNICVPISPRCSQCPLAKKLCPKVGVTKRR